MSPTATDTRRAAETGPHVADAQAAVVSGPDNAAEPTAADIVLADLLVEEISIDGMCGVY